MLFGNTVYAAGTAAPAQAQQGNGMLSLVLMIAAWIAIFYFIGIRPQKKRAKAHDELVGSIEEGDEIVTSSGIKGEVISKGDEFYEIRVDKGVKLTIKKNAIGTLYKKKGTI